MTFQIPWDALFGGMLLGVSGLVLLALNGRIAGISGIIGGLLKPSKGEFRGACCSWQAWLRQVLPPQQWVSHFRTLRH